MNHSTTGARQDPVPAVDHPLVDAKDIAALKTKVLASPGTLLLERANLLTLTAPEMTVLIGGSPSARPPR